MEKAILTKGDWKIVEQHLENKTRYLLMRLRYDASSPYWLTERIFRTFSGAKQKLHMIEIEGLQANKTRS